MASRAHKRKYWLGGKREAAQDRFFVEALDPDLWTEGDASDWDTCWYTGMPGKSVFQELDRGKTICHIPGNNGLTIKSNLYRTLADMRERVVAQEGEDSDAARRLQFFPRVYSMPGEYHALQEAALARPATHWILKPKNAARGKGISVLEDVALAPLDSSFMVQEYIGNPHTMWGHKYVLRLYALITSVEPLRVYLYNEGSAKLASAPYDPDHFDNVYAHLTNPDINATNTESESPVVFRSLASYRQWLRDEGHDDAQLFARLRDMAALTAIGVRERMRDRLAEINADTSGCYELVGFDFLVDAELNPWIMECNLSPSLEVCCAPKDGGDVEEHMKRHLVGDAVRLLNLNSTEPEPDHIQDPVERLRAVAEGELERAGNYTRVYPGPDPEAHLPFFPLPRHADLCLADIVVGGSVQRPKVRPYRVQEIIGEGRLGLYGERDGTLYTPNDVAAWIWLQATDGAAPDDIADALLEAQHAQGQTADEWGVHQQVWDVLADSAVSGLLLQHGTGGAVPGSGAEGAETGTDASGASETTIVVSAGQRVVCIKLPDTPVAARVMPWFATLTDPVPADETLSVLRSGRGYAVADRSGIQADGLRLARVAPLLREMLLRRSITDDHTLALDGVLVPLGTEDESGNPAAVLVTGRRPELAGTAGRLVASALERSCSGGIHLVPESGTARAAGLPLILEPEATDEDGVNLQLHQRNVGQPVRMGAADDSGRPVTFAVAAVVAAHRHGPQQSGSVVHAVNPIEMLPDVLPALTGPDGRAPAGAQVNALHGCLADRPLVRVDTSDRAAAEQALLHWHGELTRAVAETP